MCNKKARVSDNSSTGNLYMEQSKTDTDMIGVVGSLPTKVFCLEKVSALEANEIKVTEIESGVKAVKEDNGTDMLSCQILCLENHTDSKDPDAGLLNSRGGDLDPSTPLPDMEIVEILSSPDQAEDEDLALGCQTPTEGMFDPFAPGPEELVFAPKKKTMKGTQIPLRRQLNFDSCIDAIAMEDEQSNDSGAAAEEDRILEALCRSFLSLILSNQAEEAAAENLQLEPSTSNALRTPTSLPLLTGIAETCPGAPLRPSLKLRRPRQGTCRKLEFGSNFI